MVITLSIDNYQKPSSTSINWNIICNLIVFYLFWIVKEHSVSIYEPFFDVVQATLRPNASQLLHRRLSCGVPQDDVNHDN